MTHAQKKKAAPSQQGAALMDLDISQTTKQAQPGARAQTEPRSAP